MEEAQDEWDNVQEIVPTFSKGGTATTNTAEDSKPREKPLLTFKSAKDHLVPSVQPLKPSVRNTKWRSFLKKFLQRINYAGV